MEIFKKNRSNQPPKGFSLIEILIAFSVLTITVLACTSLITNSINNNAENAYRIQAYFLAEQGIEAIRNIRDSNWMQNIGFTNSSLQQTFWGAPIYPASSQITITVNPLYDTQIKPNGANWSIQLANESEGRLYINTLNNSEYFSHSDGLYSPFRRIIKISKKFEDLEKVIASGNSNISLDQDLILVTSTVFYDFKGIEKKIEINTILTDWKNGPL